MRDEQPVASWISSVPLLEAEYDNVLWTPSLDIRAVCTGSNLALETSNGVAFLLSAMNRDRAVELGVLDASFETQDETGESERDDMP